MARYHDRGDQGTVPELYSVFAGEVTSIQQYGAFIKIPRCKKNGLVHKSHISNSRVEDVSDVLALGDKVYCKVISLGDEGDDKVKISLSMKNINQDDGTDLDPNQVQLVQDEKRRKKSGTYIPEKIELGVVLNTTCRKCGCKGHLAQDCFKIPGGKSYELLPEDDSFLTALSQPTPSDKSSHKKKKKKDKKHKNKKKHKHRDNDSESGSENEKKMKSKYKRRRQSSDLDSDDGDRDKKQKKHSEGESCQDKKEHRHIRGDNFMRNQDREYSHRRDQGQHSHAGKSGKEFSHRKRGRDSEDDVKDRRHRHDAESDRPRDMKDHHHRRISDEKGTLDVKELHHRRDSEGYKSHEKKEYHQRRDSGEYGGPRRWENEKYEDVRKRNKHETDRYTHHDRHSKHHR